MLFQLTLDFEGAGWEVKIPENPLQFICQRMGAHGLSPLIQFHINICITRLVRKKVKNEKSFVLTSPNLSSLV